MVEPKKNTGIVDIPLASTDHSANRVESSERSEESRWEEHKPIEAKSREEEMEEYLQDLLI